MVVWVIRDECMAAMRKRDHEVRVLKFQQASTTCIRGKITSWLKVCNSVWNCSPYVCDFIGGVRAPGVDEEEIFPGKEQEE